MKHSDTSEAGFETIIFNSLITEAEYHKGTATDYNSEYAVDLTKLITFIETSQPQIATNLNINVDSPTRNKFLQRLQTEIGKRGIIDVLRKGISHHNYEINLFNASPSTKNETAKQKFKQNIFSVTRQLRYSSNNKNKSLDLVVFINGLPIATFELKNQLTKQNVNDAIEQYKNDRNPKELLFQFGRCVVHFAVDDQQVYMCTHLKGKDSWFLPFNQGHNNGAGNPPNPNGIATDYLWKKIFSKNRLTDILENYAQVINEKNNKTGKKTKKQIFPRYHQLRVVHKLLADIRQKGVGKRYLLQHSAGSGKSNSIAWLAHQLVGIDKNQTTLFDSIIIVTDRRVLDKQISNTIKAFAQVESIIGHAKQSGDLKRFISEGKQIIITTVQKFPVIVEDIGDLHRQNKFAIIIDEAHSSQGGRTTAKMHMALTNIREDDIEDTINQIMQSRKVLTNASYFAFTATPKNKTLEIFGIPETQADGKVKYRPFDVYSNKQAIEEAFILDVLQNYTPVASYYQLVKTIEDDPVFDKNKAYKKLRKYIESHSHAIGEKTAIMIDHFHNTVAHKINKQARAMVATGGISKAIEYFHAIKKYITANNLPYKAIVAFSGEHEHAGIKVTEASLNGFPSNQIEDKIIEEDYRILIVADKFLTGYDEPLMHTMYVDKPLEGIKAVQTLSRLNRSHPNKHDTFILDFFNNSEIIQKAFETYYCSTILSEATDPNKLHDLKAALDDFQIYSTKQVDTFVKYYLTNASREHLDPMLDACVNRYKQLDEDEQIEFKSKAKAFSRAYNFLATILPYSNSDWEKLSIFLNLLIPKLPAPKEEDLVKGILDSIDMDSYRVEVQERINISLSNEDAELKPISTATSTGKPEIELDNISNILQEFNDFYGDIDWQDEDKIKQIITEELPKQVAADAKYKNAMQHADEENARIEHDYALERAILRLFSDHNQLLKQFSDNNSFKKWLSDKSFDTTYKRDF
jgi:type I restriction enzyme R subunit